MRLWMAVCLMALATAGCRNSPGSSTPRLDPFMGRTTVPPPATGARPLAPAQYGANPAPPTGGTFATAAPQPSPTAEPWVATTPTPPPAGSFASASSTQQIRVPQSSLPTARFPADPRFSTDAVDIMDLPVANTARVPAGGSRQSFRVRLPSDQSDYPVQTAAWDQAL